MWGTFFIKQYELVFHKFNANHILLDSISLKIIEVLVLKASCGVLLGVPLAHPGQVDRRGYAAQGQSQLARAFFSALLLGCEAWVALRS